MQRTQEKKRVIHTELDCCTGHQMEISSSKLLEMEVWHSGDKLGLIYTRTISWVSVCASHCSEHQFISRINTVSRTIPLRVLHCLWGRWTIIVWTASDPQGPCIQSLVFRLCYSKVVEPLWGKPSRRKLAHWDWMAEKDIGTMAPSFLSSCFPVWYKPKQLWTETPKVWVRTKPSFSGTSGFYYRDRKLTQPQDMWNNRMLSLGFLTFVEGLSDTHC